MQALIFDFFGVICSEVGSPWYKTRVPPHLVSLIKERYDQPANLGRVSYDEFFAGVGEVLNITPLEARREWEERVAINQELVSLIRELRGRYKIALCSNALAPFVRKVLEEHKLQELFDEIVISSEVGLVKPDPEIFELTLGRLGVQASSAVFVDDREAHVQAARGAGLSGILFRTVADLSDL
jgi:HAD superfamily hydrolase (TIGR01509 family)